MAYKGQAYQPATSLPHPPSGFFPPPSSFSSPFSFSSPSPPLLLPFSFLSPSPPLLLPFFSLFLLLALAAARARHASHSRHLPQLLYRRRLCSSLHPLPARPLRHHLDPSLQGARTRRSALERNGRSRLAQGCQWPSTTVGSVSFSFSLSRSHPWVSVEYPFPCDLQQIRRLRLRSGRKEGETGGCFRGFDDAGEERSQSTSAFS
jgi:hypothetical protein